MNCRAKTNYAIDFLLFLSMTFVFFSGLVLWGWLRPVGMTGGAGGGHAPAVVERDRQAPARADASAASETKPNAGDSKPAAGEAKSADGPKSRIFWGLIEANTFWGMTKNGGWKSLHCWIGVAVLLPLIIFHLLMHLRWIVQGTRMFFGGAKKENSDPLMVESDPAN